VAIPLSLMFASINSTLTRHLQRPKMRSDPGPVRDRDQVICFVTRIGHTGPTLLSHDVSLGAPKCARIV